jgi:predicted  nucleic acid-binding Zn-ribbon protein
MASKKVNIDISTTANTAGAKQAAAAMDKLSTANTQAAAASTAASAGASKVGQVAASAGYQVQDFATQVSMGTSAFTAFAQQAPQFLGVFGPGGALAGALVAVGAIATKVFLDMASNAEAAGEAAQDLADKLTEAYEKRGGEKARAAIDAIRLESDLTNALRESELGLIDVKNNRIKTEEDLAKKQDDLTEKAIRYLAQIGQITNAEAALDELRKQSAERQKEAAIADVEAGVQGEIARYNNIKSQRDDLDREVSDAEARIARLQQQQQDLTNQLNISRASDERLIKAGVEGEGFKSSAVAQAESKLAGIEKQISGLFDFIDQAPQRIGELTTASYTQAAKVDQAVEGAKIEIEKIESEYKLSEKSQAITAASQQMSGAAQAISTAIEGFEPINQAQENAKNQLLQAAADGQITANEQQQVAASLNTLMGTLRAGQNTSISTLQELIRINNELASKLGAANNAISDLRSRVNNLALPQR